MYEEIQWAILWEGGSFTKFDSRDLAHKWLRLSDSMPGGTATPGVVVFQRIFYGEWEFPND